jgi:hypothetical protein
VAVTLTTEGAEFGMQAARELFDTRAVGSERTGQGTQYAVQADGQRFLVSAYDGPSWCPSPLWRIGPRL